LRTLPAVDHLLRPSRFSFTDGWCEMSPAQLAKFAGAPESWAFVALASCHGSGFVRQAALRELARRREPRGLPFIAIRLNDWVAEVRVAAQAALTGFLYASFAPALVATLPLLFSLERQRRGDHAVVVAWVRTLLQSPDSREAVLDGCLSEDADVRRLCYRLAIAAEGAEPAPILAQALSDSQPVIRVWAVRTAASDVTRPWARDVAFQALSNRSVQVRSVALQSLADVLPPEDLRRLAEKALLDESATARWQARMLRLRLGAFDLPSSTGARSPLQPRTRAVGRLSSAWASRESRTTSR
jgi:HEAT repeat protein